MLEGCEPALSDADRQSVLDELAEAGWRDEPRSTLWVLVAVLFVAVIGPLIIFLLVLWFDPRLMHWIILVGLSPLLLIVYRLVQKSQQSYRVQLAGVLRSRGVRAGACPACRYNLRGVRSERCPECGHAV